MMNLLSSAPTEFLFLKIIAKEKRKRWISSNLINITLQKIAAYLNMAKTQTKAEAIGTFLSNDQNHS